MLRFSIIVLLMCIPALAVGQTTGPVPILASNAKWQPSSAVPGSEVASLVGAGNKPGVYSVLVKFPAGTKLAPHTHPDERFATVLEGTLYVGFGETFDETKVVAVPTGGIYVAPAGVPHYVWAKDGPTIFQETGTGPTATSFVKR